MHPSPRHRTADKHRLSIGQKLAAGAGGITENLTHNAVNQLANPILNITLHLNPALVGIALAIPRLWDAFFDPFVGRWSDRTRSRWGRRRPYIFAGALLAGALFCVIWALPRGMSESFYIGYFIVTCLLFYTAAACFAIPWGALLVEVSPDYHERTRVQAYRSIMASIGGIGLPWLYAGAQASVFRDPVHGIFWVAVATGLVIAASGVLPALFVKEPPLPIAAEVVRGDRAPPRAIRPQTKSSIWSDLKESFENRPFVLSVLILLTVGPAANMMEALGLYVNIYHVYDGDTRTAAVMQGYNQTLYFVSKFAWIPLMTWTSSRIGKRHTMWICLGLTLVADVLKWFAYTPANPWLQLTVPAFASPGMASAFLLINSMIGDTTDYDEWKSGRSRTGLYFAVSQWVRKVALTGTVAVVGVMLAWIGFDAARGDQQAPSTILWLRLLFSGVPTVCTLVAMWLLYLYPLDERRVYAIRAVLDRRRQRVEANKPAATSG